MPKIQAGSPPPKPREALSAAAFPRRAGLGPKTVGSFVPGLTRQAFERYGFSAAALITDWAMIVGADLAGSTAPERLKWPRGVAATGKDEGEAEVGRPGATLVLRVDPGRALDIQYRARQLIERINAYFGYRAVAELRIVQAPIVVQASPPPRASLAHSRRAPPAAELASIEDARLRGALERMAAGLGSRAGPGAPRSKP